MVAQKFDSNRNVNGFIIPVVDVRGSTRFLFNDSGELAIAGFTDNGYASDADLEHLLDYFSGYQYDPKSGTYFVKGRAYDATVGKFLSESNGVKSGASDLYSKSANSPSGSRSRNLRVDYNGHKFVTSVIAGDVADALSPYVSPALASLQVVGGAIEVTTGAIVAAGTGWTGIGTVGGSLLIAHGLDDMYAGITSLAYPDAPPAMTYTYTIAAGGAKWLGASDTTASYVGLAADIGIGFGLTPATAIAGASKIVRAARNVSAVAKGIANAPRQILSQGLRAGLYRGFRQAGISTTYSRVLSMSRASKYSSCFVAGTLVLIPGQERPFEEVAVAAPLPMSDFELSDHYRKWIGLAVGVALTAAAASPLLSEKAGRKRQEITVDVDERNLIFVYT
ncbi:MAG: hypothetical protein AAFN77_14190 [Planctomycetota bacterium]